MFELYKAYNRKDILDIYTDEYRIPLLYDDGIFFQKENNEVLCVLPLGSEKTLIEWAYLIRWVDFTYDTMPVLFKRLNGRKTYLMFLGIEHTNTYIFVGNSWHGAILTGTENFIEFYLYSRLPPQVWYQLGGTLLPDHIFTLYSTLEQRLHDLLDDYERTGDTRLLIAWCGFVYGLYMTQVLSMVEYKSLFYHIQLPEVVRDALVAVE